MPTTPTSVVNRLMGVEAFTDALNFGGVAQTLAAGTLIGGVPVDSATKLVASTATQIVVTAAAHAGRNVVLNSTHTTTVTLPAATGTGNVYTFLVGTTGTDGSKIIQVANTTDVIQGASIAANTQSTTIGFITSATSDTVTLNNTTTGGLIGSEVSIIDVVAGTFLVSVFNIATGNPATPFSAAV